MHITLPGPRCGNGPHSFPKRRLIEKSKKEKRVRLPHTPVRRCRQSEEKTRMLQNKSQFYTNAHALRFKWYGAVWLLPFTKRGLLTSLQQIHALQAPVVTRSTGTAHVSGCSTPLVYHVCSYWIQQMNKEKQQLFSSQTSSHHH